MTPPPLAHIFGCFAAAAPRAVILRRGPSRVVQLIAWDTEHDTFEAGQWLRARVDLLGCGLSPDGELFIYAAERQEIHHGDSRAQARRLEQGPLRWTALSRPPWFTALAWWAEGSGGTFLGPRELYLCVSDEHRRAGPLTPALTLVDFVGRRPDGWDGVERGLYRKVGARATLECGFPWLTAPRPFDLVRGNERVPIENVGWADFDPHRGDLLFARCHRLYRVALPERVPLAQALADKRRIADFGAHVFECRIAPASATTWPPPP